MVCNRLAQIRPVCDESYLLKAFVDCPRDTRVTGRKGSVHSHAEEDTMPTYVVPKSIPTMISELRPTMLLKRQEREAQALADDVSDLRHDDTESL